MPPKYYFTNQTSTNHEDMERVVVSRAHSHTLTFDVVEVNSLLTWEFVSTDYDIGFGVFLTKNGKKEVMVWVIKLCNFFESKCVTRTQFAAVTVIFYHKWDSFIAKKLESVSVIHWCLKILYSLCTCRRC